MLTDHAYMCRLDAVTQHERPALLWSSLEGGGVVWADYPACKRWNYDMQQYEHKPPRKGYIDRIIKELTKPKQRRRMLRIDYWDGSQREIWTDCYIDQHRGVPAGHADHVPSGAGDERTGG